MNTKSPTPGQALTELDQVIARLLDPEGGCPWDIEQTLNSITPNILEETYELLAALRSENPDDIREEAGDLLFQTAFIGRLAQARWGWGLAEIIDQVRAKMVTRHPHVFGQGAQLSDARAVLDQWQAIKRRDKKHERLLASVPPDMPALLRAHRLNSKTARAGFDWPDAVGVRRKVDEELAELDEHLPGYDRDSAAPEHKARLKAEMGDVLLALANLARHLGFSSEEALTEANDRFVRRFGWLEEALARENLRPEDAGQERLEALWAEAKEKEPLF